MVNYDLLINQAKKLFEDGKYNESNAIYEKLLLLKEDWYLYFEIGKNYFCLENYKKSEENLLKYLNSVKEYKDLYYYALLLLIKSYKCNGDLKKALNLFKNIKFDKVPHKYVENLLKEKANILFILYERVPKIFDDSKFKELKNKYKKQLELNKNNYTAIVNLAELYLIKREYDKVVEVAKENIDSIPEEEIYFRNKLINFLETAQGKSDIKAKPLRLTINLSNQCNLRCIMCYVKEYKWKYPVDRLEEIKIFYPYLEKMMWQGGEVFSLSYFVDLIKEAAKYPNLQQGIITNAQLLTKETIDLLVNMNLELTISVDGIKKDTYEYIRKNAKFEKLVQNLQYISEKKRKVNNINFIVGINFVVTKYNYKEILPLFNIICRYGFDFFCIIPCGGDIVDEKKLYEYDNNYVTQEILEIEKRCKDSGIRLENRVTLLEKEMLKKVKLEEDTEEWLSKEETNELKDIEETGIKEFVIIKDKRIGYSSEDIDINSYNKRKMICHIPWQQLTLDYNEIYFPDYQCNVPQNKNMVKFSDMTILDIWNCKELLEYRKFLAAGREKELCKPFCYDGKTVLHYTDHIINVSGRFKNCYLKGGIDE
jgi:MoaA/NifB/PqqE/SkfB family radical SAM enzyme